MTIQRHIGVHMSDEEFKQVQPADEVAFRSPVPTQVVSNGEYNPLPQTAEQRQVEGLIKELADKQAAILNANVLGHPVGSGDLPDRTLLE